MTGIYIISHFLTKCIEVRDPDHKCVQGAARISVLAPERYMSKGILWGFNPSAYCVGDRNTGVGLRRERLLHFGKPLALGVQRVSVWPIVCDREASFSYNLQPRILYPAYAVNKYIYLFTVYICFVPLLYWYQMLQSEVTSLFILMNQPPGTCVNVRDYTRQIVSLTDPRLSWHLKLFWPDGLSYDAWSEM